MIQTKPRLQNIDLQYVSSLNPLMPTICTGMAPSSDLKVLGLAWGRRIASHPASRLLQHRDAVHRRTPQVTVSILHGQAFRPRSEPPDQSALVHARVQCCHVQGVAALCRGRGELYLGKHRRGHRLATSRTMEKYPSHEVYCPSRRTRPLRVGVTAVRYAPVRVAIKHPFCTSASLTILLSYPHTRVAPGEQPLTTRTNLLDTLYSFRESRHPLIQYEYCTSTHARCTLRAWHDGWSIPSCAKCPGTIGAGPTPGAAPASTQCPTHSTGHDERSQSL